MGVSEPITEDRLDRSRERIGRKANATKESSRDWTIKRLPPETIEVTRDAARRSGMKINAWVGQALEKAAGARSSAPEHVEDDPKKVLQLETNILQEIAQLRAQNEDLVQTVNSISAILLKMYTSKLQSEG